MEIRIQEKYSSGWRGAPAKGVDGSRRARVQIPLSPLFFSEKGRMKKFQKTFKNFLTKQNRCDNLNELSQRQQGLEKIK